MKYVLMGNTGLRVSEISLGTMTFGTEWGWGADKDVSKEIFDAYTNAGGNFIDTANRYTEGTSERWVGEFISADRDHFVVATKYTLFDKRNDLNYCGNHRKNMIRSVEESLRRLKTDYIDLLYLHIWDSTTPIEEVLRGMDDLVSSGKIHYAGISDTPAWVVAKGNTLADAHLKTRFNALQIEYSLIQRTVESDLLPMAEHFNIAVTAWAPLAGGALTGKYLENTSEERRLAEASERLNDRNTAIAREVVAIASETGLSPAQVALRWVMQRPQRIIPIVGARKTAQITDCLGAATVHLSEEYINRLDTVSSIRYGFPHDFFRQDGVREVTYSGDVNKLEW